MNNRRNFYRILQVQPEAPVEVIKASYRALMTKLNAHPDRGGDHENAVLINQAYAVLSDVQKRKKYDDILLNRLQEGGKNGAGNSHFKKSQSFDSENEHSSRDFRNRHRTSSKNSQLRCMFCLTEYTSQVQQHCHYCKSPLSPVKRFSVKRSDELLGRRAVPRIEKEGLLAIFPSWPHAGHKGQLQDLSISGLRALTDYHAKTGQILKFDAPFFKGVGRVVSVRAVGRRFSVHATFLTTEFVTKSGTFVAQKA
jgi:curved DNA-binding protein CbpA